MPVIYELDRTSALIRTRCVDQVTVTEIAAHFQELLGEAELPNPLDTLLDLSEMQGVPEANELQSVVTEMALLKQRLGLGAIAIVAEEDIMFGMIRMFTVFLEPHFTGVSVFRKAQEAEGWLSDIGGAGANR
ncbi:MAG: STAS/SEC14 domain-containing protein [Halieaceae bacterium]